MSWRLGKAFGIDIFVHWTFFLLVPFILFTNGGKGLSIALLSLVVVVTLFGCIVLHELGHALTARQFGIGTRDITLYPIGGVARLERMSEHPAEEFLIAVAGPAVNVVIALVLGIGLALTASNWIQAAFSTQNVDAVLRLPLLAQFLIALLILNIGLVLFNMAPAFPMDGGRVLRAFLASIFDYARATEIASKVGLVVACMFLFVGLFGIPGLQTGSSPMLIVVALFVVFAGQQELAMVRHRAAYRARHPGVDIDNCVVIDGRVTPPEPHFSGFTWSQRGRMWIEWRDGQPIQACQVG